MNNKLIF